MFSTRLDNFLPFSSNLKLLSANSFSLEESNICRLVMLIILLKTMFLVYRSQFIGQSTDLRSVAFSCPHEIWATIGLILFKLPRLTQNIANAYYILVTVQWSFTELLPFDEFFSKICSPLLYLALFKPVQFTPGWYSVPRSNQNIFGKKL